MHMTSRDTLHKIHPIEIFVYLVLFCLAYLVPGQCVYSWSFLFVFLFGYFFWAGRCSFSLSLAVSVSVWALVPSSWCQGQFELQWCLVSWLALRIGPGKDLGRLSQSQVVFACSSSRLHLLVVAVLICSCAIVYLQVLSTIGECLLLYCILIHASCYMQRHLGWLQFCFTEVLRVSEH